MLLCCLASRPAGSGRTPSLLNQIESTTSGGEPVRRFAIHSAISQVLLPVLLEPMVLPAKTGAAASRLNDHCSVQSGMFVAGGNSLRYCSWHCIPRRYIIASACAIPRFSHLIRIIRDAPPKPVKRVASQSSRLGGSSTLHAVLASIERAALLRCDDRFTSQNPRSKHLLAIVVKYVLTFLVLIEVPFDAVSELASAEDKGERDSFAALLVVPGPLRRQLNSQLKAIALGAG